MFEQESQEVQEGQEVSLNFTVSSRSSRPIVKEQGKGEGNNNNYNNGSLDILGLAEQ